MGAYQNEIKKSHNLRMEEVIHICKQLLPEEWKRMPYRHPELLNGLNLLHSEEGMNAYMAAYGEMHMMKCRAALQNVPYDNLQGSIEIVDWGCGQGIGSMCAIETLEQHDKLMWLKKVTLVEPSPFTLQRAKENITCATNGGITILSVNCYLPGDDSQDEIEGISYNMQNVIHVFSNILDVINIDLRKLAKMISTSGHKHYILCIGPVNYQSYRIEQFCSIFGEQELFSNIHDSAYGRTSDTYHIFTCKTKCFVYNGNPLNFGNMDNVVIPTMVDNTTIYGEYDPMLSVQNGLISKATADLFSIFSKVLRDEDILLLKPNINGDRPDMVIVRPNKGILLVHVFEDDLSNYHFFQQSRDIDGNIEITERTTMIQKAGSLPINSPLTTIDTYQDDLVRLHLEGMLNKVLEESKNWSIIKKLVFFSQNTSQEANEFFKKASRNHVLFYGKELLSDEKEKKNILYSLRFNTDVKEFDDRIMRSFMRIITPKWHSYKEGKVIHLETVQRNLSKSVADKRQKISGAAGAGKTQVLATRAVNAQLRTGGKVLVLTYNKTLANYVRYRINEIRADFPLDKITIDYYHHFFRTQAHNCDMGYMAYDNENAFEGKDNQIEKYGAIFIDEVQDYLTPWLRILNKYFLEEHGEFVVFGDPKQNVYRRDLDSQGDIRIEFISGTWNHELKNGKRFANPQLALLAKDFQKTFFTANANIDDFGDTQIKQGSLLSKIMYGNIGRTTDTQKLANYCNKIINHYQLRAEETVVLSQAGDILRDIDFNYRQITGLPTITTFISFEEYDNLLRVHKLENDINPIANYMFKRDKEAIEHNKRIHFTMETDGLKMSTIHSYKGWESPNVIIFLEPELQEREKYCVSARENVPELIYTAITRAKDNLYIINLGNEKYHQFFDDHKN